ncbi:BTB/POZ domain-containing protein At3g09030-like [Neltuma alba]|uniref:BTB/POZ domain-containing protein At3g09030-like n=1 Tax=Neltuma alba TaxID=207710 RepID=UPI0010A3957E|nr:BTB/POZ domain-containing protein At3g09030-like [Prosopis alba]
MDVANSDSNYVASPNDPIKLNIGGKLFEATLATLRPGGPDSLLTALSVCDTCDDHPIFIDRDPKIFSVLFSPLRPNPLPSASRRFCRQELPDEALYYGIDAQLSNGLRKQPPDRPTDDLAKEGGKKNKKGNNASGNESSHTPDSPMIEAPTNEVISTSTESQI